MSQLIVITGAFIAFYVLHFLHNDWLFLVISGETLLVYAHAYNNGVVPHFKVWPKISNLKPKIIFGVNGAAIFIFQFMEADDLIEELSTNDVPESELAQFTETQLLELHDVLPSDTTNNDVAGEITEVSLIRKFVCGEADLPECYTKLEPEEDEEDEESVQGNQQPDELPSTSQGAVSALPPSTTTAAKNLHAVNTVIDATHSTQRCNFTSSRKRTVLSPALQGLMGEANLSYARGQIQMAEKICLEIIRQNPLAPEPFLTLAEIYELRDTDKYLDFLTIAAHLNPHDRDQWIRIAEMHIVQGNLQRARIYYSKAIKVLPKDYDLRLRKARLLELMGESYAAMITYLRMIPHIPPQCASLCLQTANNVAHYFHDLSKHNFALEAMDSAYTVCASHFTLQDLNLYMELLILNKAYAKVLSCLRQRTNLHIETEQEDNLELIFFCVIPDDYLPDFRAKLCVSLIHLRAHHLLGYLIQNIHDHIPIVDERLDLYIDIAEALMHERKYVEAINLLRPITDAQTLECPAFVWLRHAECLRHLNRTSDAIQSYTRVVDLAPFCYEAKFTLSALLKQQGRHIEAVKALQQTGEIDGQPLNARLLYERCLMLQQIGDLDEFFQLGYILLARQSIKLRNREEMLAAASGGSFYNAEGLKVILQMRNITDDTDKALQEYNKPQQENSDLTIQDEYQIFLELVRTAYTHRKFSYIERICFAMVTTKRFVCFHIELERIIILACYFNDDCSIAFSYLRELITKTPVNNALWNLLSLMVQKGQDLRYHRYVRRLLQRLPSARHQRILMANYHLHSSSYKYALNIYVPMFKEQQLPLLALCIAVVFNQLSMQRKVLRKTAAVAQSIAFARKYGELRGVHTTIATEACNNTSQHVESAASAMDLPENSAAEQEVYYNIARIYHQAGMLHLAVEHYERALAARHPLVEENERYLGLRQEIAFNLHLIYRSSNNFRKARQYLYEHCVV